MQYVFPHRKLACMFLPHKGSSRYRKIQRCMAKSLTMTGSPRPRIMGIINVTTDSFYADSRYMDCEEIATKAETMVMEGAQIIDIGAESTRPGATAVESSMQIKRIIPAVREIRTRTNIDISIDTRSAAVAEAALNAGATLINDISALQADPQMADLAAERDVPVILMHMQGTPETMQNAPYYSDVISEVKTFLIKSIDRALSKGIKESNIILDPGIGFGKRLEDNIALLRNLSQLKIDKFPLLLGLSRKSFIAGILDKYDEKLRQDISFRLISDTEKVSLSPPSPRTPEERLYGTLAIHAWSLAQGVDILRVHDVRKTHDIVAIREAMAWVS